MYRFQIALLILTFLPLVMAFISAFAITPKRQQSMTDTLNAAAKAPLDNPTISAPSSFVDEAIQRTLDKLQGEFQSLYQLRMLIPAALLCILYYCMLSIGVSALPFQTRDDLILCRPFLYFDHRFLINPSFAALGAYVFNFGFLARRGYMADVTKNAFWSCVNRLIFSVGFGIALSMATSTKSWGLGTESVGFAAFAVAFIPRIALSWLRRAGTNYFGQQDDSIKELSLQLIQGIDIWKVARLEEEGIESIQNLATANAVTLAAKMHYPLRTIVDWVDQAIFIQRFPEKFKVLPALGIPVSAIEFAWLANNKDCAALNILAQKLDVDPQLLTFTSQSFAQDLYVNVLWRLWQSIEPDE
jgi:hypothetical protein